MTKNTIKGFALMLLGIILMLVCIVLLMMNGAVIGIIVGAIGLIVGVVGFQFAWPTDGQDDSNNQQKPIGKEQ